jgi:drug/metabolite transporter (DMT)-like permease
MVLLSIETRATSATPEPKPLWRLWLLGGTGILGFALTYTYGLALAGNIQGSLVSAAFPAGTVLVAWALKGVRPDGAMQLALVLALVGALIGIAGGHDLSRVHVPGLGEALLLLSNVLWSWYSLKAQDWLRGWSHLRIAAWSIGMAGVTSFVLVAALLALELIRIPPVPGLADALVLIYIVAGPTLFGLLGWNYGVRVLGLPVSGLYMNLVPVTAVLTAIALGDRPNLWQLVGGLLIIAGIVQAQIRRLTGEAASATRSR